MPFPPAVVNRLAQFSGPNVQSVRVGEFHQCFDVLLSHQSCPLNLSWAKAKLHLAAHDNNAGFKASTIVSRTCLRAAAVDRQPDWPAVYLLAMIWGFGETNGKPAKDGPPKLFVSTQTADVAIKLDKVAAEVVAGNLAASFDAICTQDGGAKLRQMGTSFGTKFLFIVGMRLRQEAVHPLVFDRRIAKALLALRAGFPDDLNATDFPWFKVADGAEYQSYCSCIKETAALMNKVEGGFYDQWDSYKLEQLLFERAENIGEQ